MRSGRLPVASGQVREEVNLTDGRIMVRGRFHKRGKNKRADYVLFLKPGVPHPSELVVGPWSFVVKH